MQVETETLDGLVTEFGTTQIPLAACCQIYFGCDIDHAKEKAAAHKLPVPAFKVGSRKAQWFIHACDLALHIDRSRDKQAAAFHAAQEGGS